MTVMDAPTTGQLTSSLVAVTEAAALAASRWIGRADKHAADQAAVDAMRTAMVALPVAGTVVIGEGEKDEAPMLYRGERVGAPGGPRYDLAVDPVDGTTLTAKGMPGAVAVLAASPAGTMLDPPSVHYLEKLVAGPGAEVDIEAPVAENLAAAARARGRAVSELTVCVLDRPRHQELVGQVCAAGARVRLIPDGDVVAAAAAAGAGGGVDLLMGIGGTPEGVLSACAVRCLGGVMRARLHPRSPTERSALRNAGWDPGRVLTERDLVDGDDAVLVLTGITDGELVAGVRADGPVASTESVVFDARDRSMFRVRHRRLAG